MNRQCAHVLAAEAGGDGRLGCRSVDCALSHRDTQAVGEAEDQPEVFGDQIEAERYGCVVWLLEGRPLVLDERRRRRARGENPVATSDSESATLMA